MNYLEDQRGYLGPNWASVENVEVEMDMWCCEAWMVPESAGMEVELRELDTHYIWEQAQEVALKQN